MKYFVTEIQVWPTGAAQTPTYAYDSGSYASIDEARNAAYARYYTSLANAAKSTLPSFAVMIYTDLGQFIQSEVFTHPQPEPEPEPDPEPEPEPEPDPEPEEGGDEGDGEGDGGTTGGEGE